MSTPLAVVMLFSILLLNWWLSVKEKRRSDALRETLEKIVRKRTDCPGDADLEEAQNMREEAQSLWDSVEPGREDMKIELESLKNELVELSAGILQAREARHNLKNLLLLSEAANTKADDALDGLKEQMLWVDESLQEAEIETRCMQSRLKEIRGFQAELERIESRISHLLD